MVTLLEVHQSAVCSHQSLAPLCIFYAYPVQICMSAASRRTFDNIGTLPSRDFHELGEQISALGNIQFRFISFSSIIVTRTARKGKSA